MQLVGAPLAYIRGPFVVEGLIQGGVGAVLALAVLWAVFAWLRYRADRLRWRASILVGGISVDPDVRRAAGRRHGRRLHRRTDCGPEHPRNCRLIAVENSLTLRRLAFKLLFTYIP